MCIKLFLSNYFRTLILYFIAAETSVFKFYFYLRAFRDDKKDVSFYFLLYSTEWPLIWGKRSIYSRKFRRVSTNNIVSLLFPSYRFCLSLFLIDASFYVIVMLFRWNFVWYQKNFQIKRKSVPKLFQNWGILLVFIIFHKEERIFLQIKNCRKLFFERFFKTSYSTLFRCLDAMLQNWTVCLFEWQ